MEDEMTCIFFNCEDYKLILDYQKEINAKSAKDAVIDAINLALDCTKLRAIKGECYD